MAAESAPQPATAPSPILINNVRIFDGVSRLLVDKKSFWSGTEGRHLTDQLADLLNVPNRQTGWIVKSLAKGSPAEEVGLRGATMVVKIAGQDVSLVGRSLFAKF